MNIEQMKKIVEGAPEGESHYNADFNIFESRIDLYRLSNLHNLSDLHTIIAQTEEIERLREALITCHNAHPDYYVEQPEVIAAIEGRNTPKGGGE